MTEKGRTGLSEPKLGELLCQAGIISQQQLAQALKLQKQRGGRIGAILLELGFITNSSLVHALGEKHHVKVADLDGLEISPDVLSIIPFEKMKQYEMLPIAAGPSIVFLAMADPGNFNTLKELEFFLGRSIQPVVVPSNQIQAAISLLAENRGKLDRPLCGKELLARIRQGTPGTLFPSVRELCQQMLAKQASDLLLSAGAPHSLKKHGELVRLPYPSLTPQKMDEYAHELTTKSQWEEFERTGELDFTHTFPDIGRFRVNIFRQRGSISISIRTIVDEIPGFAALGLPDWLESFALRPYGLILISGPTGQGKTTTLASMVDLINARRRVNIITIEEPIEYHHHHKLSNVNQREVGVDTDSFQEGLKRIFRQSPDVIVVGEMRDPESAAIAIQAAGTGHLVLTTVHANSATATVERIIDTFTPYQQHLIRGQLAEHLLLVLNQRLVPAKDGKGMVLAYEKLVNTYRVRALIREGKTHQIRNMFQQATDDFQSLDVTLAQLCRQGKIQVEEGRRFCDNQAFFQEMVGHKRK